MDRIAENPMPYIEIHFASCDTRHVGNEAWRQLHTVYLPLDNQGKAVLLGSGRYALVCLANASSDLNGAFLALKFLRWDESHTASVIARCRFLEEARNTDRCTRGGDTRLIGYRGYGFFPNLRPSTPDYTFNSNIENSDSDTNNVDQRLNQLKGHVLDLTKIKISDGSIAAKNEANSEMLRRAFPDRVQLQGDFMVLNAAYGTLENLMVDPSSWQDWPRFSAYKSEMAINLSIYDSAYISLQRDQERFTPIVKKFLEALDPSSNNGSAKYSSPFDLLDGIGAKESMLKCLIALKIAKQLIVAIELLHSAKDSEKAFAHRDIKPGNFLITSLPGSLEIKASDLGFSADVRSIKSQFETVAYNPRDPGALSLGTPFFRSPEALQGVGEIAYSTASDNGNLVRIDKLSATIRPEPGDWFEPKDSQLAGGRNFAHIFSVKSSEDGRVWDMQLKNSVQHEINLRQKRGYIVKTIDQRSDLFSAGCVLYFLFSGGKDPESFYSKLVDVYVGNVSPQSNTSRNDGLDWAYLSPLTLAAALTEELDEYESLIEEISEKFDAKTPESSWLSKAWSGVEFKHRWRASKPLRSNPVSKGLLRDSAGKSIPFPILYIIVCCMFRGKASELTKADFSTKESEPNSTAIGLNSKSSSFANKPDQNLPGIEQNAAGTPLSNAEKLVENEEGEPDSDSFIVRRRAPHETENTDVPPYAGRLKTRIDLCIMEVQKKLISRDPPLLRALQGVDEDLVSAFLKVRLFRPQRTESGGR
jgi:serine/threonine protein kinase